MKCLLWSLTEVVLGDPRSTSTLLCLGGVGVLFMSISILNTGLSNLLKGKRTTERLSVSQTVPPLPQRRDTLSGSLIELSFNVLNASSLLIEEDAAEEGKGE